MNDVELSVLLNALHHVDNLAVHRNVLDRITNSGDVTRRQVLGIFPASRNGNSRKKILKFFPVNKGLIITKLRKMIYITMLKN